MQRYSLDNINIHMKYKTRAARFYRENLDNIMEGKDLCHPPDISDGQEIEETKSVYGGGITSYGSDDIFQKERKSPSGFKQKFAKGKKKVEAWGMNIGTGIGKLFKKEGYFII